MDSEIQDGHTGENNHDQQPKQAEAPNGTPAAIKFIHDNVPNFSVCEHD